MNKYVLDEVKKLKNRNVRITKEEYDQKLEQGFKDESDIVKKEWQDSYGNHQDNYYYPLNDIENWSDSDFYKYFQLQQIKLLENLSEMNAKLKTIKSIMVFFCVLTIIGIIASFIWGYKISEFFSLYRFRY